MAAAPIIPLYRYQQRYLTDTARLKGWLKSRQIGGSFTATLEMTLDALETGEDWNTMSRSQRQAEKLLLKAAKHLKAINRYVVDILKNPPVVQEANIGSQRIRLENGATLEALPCDPDTTAGDTVNWLIDEFPLFPKSDKVFGIIKPSIMHGRKLRVIGTPRGRQNKFYNLWKQWEQFDKASGWSWHKTTIEEAVSDGLQLMDSNGRPLPFEKWREQEIRDIGPEMFLQEYMCVFSDTLIAFLPYQLILGCQAANLPLVRPADALLNLSRTLYLGVDVGRRHDLTVIWVISKTGDVHTTESVFVLDRMPFVEQERIIAELLGLKNVSAPCIDDQGIGMQLVENLAGRFPGRVDGVSFTNALKAEMAHRLKVAMQSENFWMPTDPDIVADFESIERDITDTGLIKIAAPRSASGHGDRFWAACLALHRAAVHKPFELVLAV